MTKTLCYLFFCLSLFGCGGGGGSGGGEGIGYPAPSSVATTTVSSSENQIIIQVVNNTTIPIPQEDWVPEMLAVESQLQNEFYNSWHIRAHIVDTDKKNINSNFRTIYCVDSLPDLTRQGKELGYHLGLQGYVDVPLCRRIAPSQWHGTFSHETLEIIPTGYEICDPVENQLYGTHPANKLPTCSNFVDPSYYRIEAGPPYDFLNNIKTIP